MEWCTLGAAGGDAAALAGGEGSGGTKGRCTEAMNHAGTNGPTTWERVRRFVVGERRG